jgi:hypothetical protein
VVTTTDTVGSEGVALRTFTTEIASRLLLGSDLFRRE